jgi:hypothetical protein
MITQYSHNHQQKIISKQWLDELEVMQLMQINDHTLETWRQFKVIGWCNINDSTYYDAADVEWMQAVRTPLKD